MSLILTCGSAVGSIGCLRLVAASVALPTADAVAPLTRLVLPALAIAATPPATADAMVTPHSLVSGDYCFLLSTKRFKLSCPIVFTLVNVCMFFLLVLQIRMTTAVVLTKPGHQYIVYVTTHQSFASNR
ncbi:MAG: hypothetical protein DYG89_45285 [Caldilinea sp. CFX5]|nr:hypothetical protein [Caldilinea sp. CFX5]